MSNDPEAIAGRIAKRWRPKIEAQKPVVRERFRALFRTLGEPFTEVDVTAHAFVEALELTPFLTAPSSPPETQHLRAFVSLSRRLGLRAFGAHVEGAALVLFPGLRRLVIAGKDHGYFGEDTGLLAGIMALDFAPEDLIAPARGDAGYAEELGGFVWKWIRPPVS